jgi:hemolysin activation/secretion protein
MRKQNNYNFFTVIFTLLLLVQALYANAGEVTNKSVDAPVSPDATSAKDTKSEAVNPSDVEVKPLESQIEVTDSEKKINNKEVNYFDILEFQVQGNTKLNSQQIEAAVYPLMGEKKSIEDVEKAREALEKAYHEAGYLTALVDIPEQDVDNKIVKLNVTEGKVSRLRVKDSNYFSLGRIKTLAPSVKEGEVPHFPSLQKDMTRLNRTADKRVTPVMKAGKVFGTVDVDLKVEDSLPLHASLELNDRYSQDTTKPRLGGTIKYDNLWQREHSLSLNFLISPENTNEVRVLSANYLMRFDDTDLLLAMYGIKSKSNVATVGGIDILGDGTILGVRLIKPLPSLDNYYHSASFGFDYKKFGQKIVFGDTSDSPVTYMPLAASYTGTWQETKSTTQFTTDLILGLRGLVADEAEFADRRPGVNGGEDAKPNFFIAKAELQRTQALPNGFEGFAVLDAQYSGSPLIANEQYLAGGLDTVRGYLESEASGDRAVHTTLELRTPSLFKNTAWIKDFKIAAFYDMARLSTIDADSATLSGAGISLRLKALKGFNANLDLAVPLKDALATEQGDFRTHMRFWYEF